MPLQVVCALIVLFACLNCCTQTLAAPQGRSSIYDNIHEALKENEIIPDVCDDFYPSALLSVYYPSSKKEVALGNNLQPEDTADEPSIQISPEPTEEERKYTVVLTDPDAPSRENPIYSEYCHWISSDWECPSIGNVGLVKTLEETCARGGKEVISYVGPAPPPKTGKHRYVFLLFRHGPNTPAQLEGPKDRLNWGTGKPRHGARQWARANDLELVGANFFFAKNKEQ